MQIGLYKFPGTISHYIRVGMALYRICDPGIILSISLIQNEIMDQRLILLCHGVVILREDSHPTVINHAPRHLLDRHA